MSSEKSRSAVAFSAGSPVMVISLPRTCTSLVRVRSMSRRISSLAPSRLTMIFGSETEILVCTRAAPAEPALEGFGIPVIGRPDGPAPPALFLFAASSLGELEGSCHPIRSHAGAPRPLSALPRRAADRTRPVSPRARRGRALRRTAVERLLTGRDRPAVEGLLHPAEPVRRPVHPHHRAARVPGQPQELADLPPGDRTQHVGPVGQRPEHRRWPVRRRVGEPRLQRAVVPREDEM